jgi:hypothetical protein
MVGTLALPLTLDAQSTTPQPSYLHQCVQTKISELGSRLEGQADSGSAVAYESGATGVSYDVIAAIQMSRVGDPVIVCLTRIPKGCPKGDDRGKAYSAQNQRTGGKWELPDSEHECGGA